LLGAGSYSKTPTANKLDKWAGSTFEISLQPVNALMKSFEVSTSHWFRLKQMMA